jgi:uncharacterized protein YjiS (DUF1127 family)
VLIYTDNSVKYKSAASQHYTTYIEEKMKQLITWWKRRQAFNETYTQLSRLSTRELEDIGISRSMISRIALEMSEKV